jgi:hypothetical protein
VSKTARAIAPCRGPIVQVTITNPNTNDAVRVAIASYFAPKNSVESELG